MNNSTLNRQKNSIGLTVANSSSIKKAYSEGKKNRETDEDTNGHGHQASDSSSQVSDCRLNYIPVSKSHFQRHIKRYDSSPYDIIHLHPNAKRIKSQYRRERMHASPKQGYTAPFSCQAIRYGIGNEEDRNLRLSKGYERRRRLKSLSEESNKKYKNQNNHDNFVEIENKKKDRTVCISYEINGDNPGSDENNNTKSHSSNASNEKSKKYAQESSASQKRKNAQMNHIPHATSPSNAEREKFISLSREWTPLGGEGQVGDNPLYYGNCLILLPCLCRICARTRNVVMEEETDTISSSKSTSSMSNNLSCEDQSISSSSLLVPQSLPSARSGSNHVNITLGIADNGIKSENSQCRNNSSTFTKDAFQNNTQSDTKNDRCYDKNYVKSHEYDGIPKEKTLPKPKSTYPRWFLLHPVGNCVSVSALLMPIESDSGRFNTKYLRKTIRGKVNVDVGGKVLQIGGCFDIRRFLSDDFRHNNDGQWKWYFVARTPSHCSLISCTTTDNQLQNLECNGYCTMKEVARIDIRQSLKNGITNVPIHLAVNPGLVTPYMRDPTFAILTRSSPNSPYSEEGSNTIQRVIAQNASKMKIQKHVIANVNSMSLIEFSSMHPMVLWSAARSSFNSILHKNWAGRYRHPKMGYGHSLYSIDLRSNQAAFMWSPSHSELHFEGIHSLSGILSDTDSTNGSSVFVSSISSGAMWEIDCRMPVKSLCSWKLAGLCDDWGSRSMTSTIYGSGILMTRPVESFRSNVGKKLSFTPFSAEMSRKRTPVLGVSKNPGSYGLHIYRTASTATRFQTRNLERPETGGMDSWADSDNLRPTGIATTGIFKLPDTSAGLFCNGIAAFYAPTRSVLTHDQLDLGYRDLPSRVLCIISSTSRGDLYTHTLLECSGNEETRAISFEGLPIGCCAVPIPYHNECNVIEKSNFFPMHGSLQWHLSNTYPVPGQAVLKHNVGRRSQCRSFETVQHQQHLPKYSSNEYSDKIVGINHTRSCMQFENDTVSPSLKLPSAYVHESKKLMKGKRTVENGNEAQSQNSSLSSSNIICTSKTDMNRKTVKHLKETWSG